MNGKGDKDRTTDRKAYRKNYDGVRWPKKKKLPPLMVREVDLLLDWNDVEESYKMFLDGTKGMKQ